MGAQAIDDVKMEMMRMTYAHAYVLYSNFFYKRVQTSDGDHIHADLHPRSSYVIAAADPPGRF